MTTTSTGPHTLDGAVPPPPRPGPPLPPALAPAGVQPSELARRSPITHVRYAALATENLAESVAFYEGIWGLYPVGSDGGVTFLGAVGSPEPFVIRLRAAAERRTDLIAFGAKDPAAVDELAAALASNGVRLAAEPGTLAMPGGGYGFRFFDPDGRLAEVSADVAAKPFREVEPGESVPRKLSHIVVNSPDAPALVAFYERYFGLRLSDWLEDRMAFMRCSADHHSLAIAAAPHAGLNHVSFEMRDIDEYMRGTGRMVRHGHAPLWGPGGTAPATTCTPTSPGRTTSWWSTRPRWSGSPTRTPGCRGSGPRRRSTRTAGARPVPARTCSRCGTARRRSLGCGSRHRSEACRRAGGGLAGSAGRPGDEGRPAASGHARDDPAVDGQSGPGRVRRMSASSHDHPELGPPQLAEVADGVFAYIQPDGSWYINNTGFVVGRSSVISVNACSTERRTRAYLDRIASVSKAPVTMLINTHHHGDHTYGNSLFGTATIIAQENCRAEMIALGMPGNTGIWEPVDWGEMTLAPPTFTFADRVRLWSDDRPLEVSYVGRPRTPATTAWCGCRGSRCCSAATCCSTAARRSCSWARCGARSTC